MRHFIFQGSKVVNCCSCIFLDYTLGRFGRTWEQESLERTDVAGRSRTLGISSYNPIIFLARFDSDNLTVVTYVIDEPAN